jgi:hypothetical protein
MRRLLLLVLALLVSGPVRAESADVALTREAFRFGFPVYEMARTRSAATSLLPTNMLGHRRTLSDASSRWVTTPNNDTLYSSAWLDLRAGPVLLTMPPLPNRYHSAAMMDVFTDNFTILGTRNQAGKGGRYAIVGPDWTGSPPNDATVVKARTNDVWLLIRTLVDGPADLEAARTAQDGFKLAPVSSSTGTATFAAPPTPDVATFINVVGEMLGRSSIPELHRARFGRLAASGLIAGATWDGLSATQQAVWQANFAAFQSELRGGLGAVGETHAGWSYGKANVGDFGQDDRTRALIALGGLAALPPAEAMYMTGKTDSAGQAFDGGKTYRLRIPPKGLPLRGFWSLSMYQVEPDGRLFFVDNPANRFAIGDRTAGLQKNGDGSLDILISRTAPTGSAGSNWLPAPAGQFRLIMRAYLPKPELLNGKWRLPAIEQLP